MGGAGTVISNAAMRKMNISGCVERQETGRLERDTKKEWTLGACCGPNQCPCVFLPDLAWNRVASDWRLSLCLEQAGIELNNVLAMYQGGDFVFVKNRKERWNPGGMINWPCLL